MHATRVSLSLAAKNHIENIKNQIENQESWFNEQLEDCKFEMDAISKVIEPYKYLNCITASIDNYIAKSTFNFGEFGTDTVSTFADNCVLNIVEDLKDDDYDSMCLFCMMNYTKYSQAQIILKWVLDEFKTNPTKFEHTSLPQLLYLWKKEDMSDFDLIRRIFDMWVNLLLNTTIDYDKYTSVYIFTNKPEDYIEDEVFETINEFIPTGV